MSKEIAGIKLSSFEEPIRDALKAYEQSTGHILEFDEESASRLDLTLDKPNSGRSATPVLYHGENVGNLFVIAFKPGDGSGDESGYKLEDLVDTIAPPTTRRIPRNKTGVHSEAHLTLATHKIDDTHSDPRLFDGTFELLGLSGNKISRIGRLGHSGLIASGEIEAHPLATLTVGYDRSSDRRFGDPHAVYSSVPDAVQVCAFLAVSEEIHKQHPDLLHQLQPVLPYEN